MITLYCIRPEAFNVGNDVIFIAMQGFLYEAFGEVVNLVSLPATSRYESHAKAGLTPKTVHEINQYGDGVIIGGGNLYENGELDVNFEATKSLEVPLMLFSISRGRIYNKRRELVRRTDVMPDEKLLKLNQIANISIARDKATTDYIKRLGCPNIILGGCPTLFLNETTNIPGEFPSANIGTAFISVRTAELMSIPINLRKRVHGQIEKIIEVLRKRKYSDIRFLCHDHRDIPFAASFDNIEFVYTGDAHAFLALLKNASLCVSFRLHATLPCLSYGTPVINISYDERAGSMLETIGLKDWNINLVLEDDLIATIKNRLDRLDELVDIKKNNVKDWLELKASMRDGLADFAKKVKSGMANASGAVT